MAIDYTFDSVLLNTRNNLSYLLTTGNLSLTALSELLGVTKAYVSRWISGDTVPSFKAVIGVCRIFEVSVEDFCLSNIEKALNEGIIAADVVPQNDDDALALSMFQTLPDFDRESVLRIMQSLCADGSVSEIDFKSSVLPQKED